MKRKFVTILGVKIPFENIRSAPQFGGWVSYIFGYSAMLTPPINTRLKNIDVPSTTDYE